MKTEKSNISFGEAVGIAHKPESRFMSLRAHASKLLPTLKFISKSIINANSCDSSSETLIVKDHASSEGTHST